jgi:hypothetical protein
MKFHPLRTLVLVFCMSQTVIAPSNAQTSDSSPCFEEYANTLLSSFIALAEQHIRTIERELAVLSVTEEVKSADWEKMHNIMQAYQEGGLSGIVWFVLPDGNYYTTEQGLVGKKLNERSYFPGLMSGRRMFGDLVYSRATGRKSVIVAVPVMRSGEVVGGLGASIFLDDLSNRIDAAVPLPQNLLFYALAPDGTTTLHKNTQLNFQDPRQQGTKSLKLAADRMLSTPEGEVNYEFEGTSRRVIYRTSVLMGWKFAIGIKTSDSGSTAGQ